MKDYSDSDFLEDISEDIDYALVGPKDTRIHEIRTERFPFNTVCSIERDFGNNRWSGCTGTLISPRLVLTAGHCLYNYRRGRAPIRIRIIPGRSDRDTTPYGSIISQRYFAPKRYVNIPHPRHRDRKFFDYGIIILPRPFHGISQFMKVRPLSDNALKKLKSTGLITIAGYPGDKPRGTLWRHAERLKKITPRRLLYTVDTCPGHSGSPIWYFDKKKGTSYIIGIHTSGIVDERGRSYGCSKDTVLAPPGLMNSGVRITSEVFENIINPRRTVAGKKIMLPFP